MTALDETFRARRATLRDQTVQATAAIWQEHHDDRNRYLAQALTTVEGGQRAMVTLVSGYLTAKARETGRARFKSLNLDNYTVAKLRGTSGPDVYSRPYGALYGQLNAGASEEQAHASALDALGKLAATDIHMAYTAAANDWMKGDKQIAAFKRVPSGTCDYCEAAAQGLYHPKVQMPIHENCVVGETIVSAALVGPTSATRAGSEFRAAQATTRRWYRGEIVVLETANGHNLTVTPNHPIFTPQGWVAAGLLREGDGVISSRRSDGVVGRVPHEEDMPSRIEDRFRSRSVRSFVTVPFAAEHFHGDAGDGQVDVVSADRRLDAWSLAARFEPTEHLAFTPRSRLAVGLAGERGGLQPILAGRDSSESGVCRAHAHLADLGIDPGGADPRLFASGTRLDAAVHEVLPNRLATDARGPREFLNGFSGEVVLDDVRVARRVDFDGHVYNLSTREGWFAANGIVTHNCECDLEPVFGAAAVVATGLGFHSGDSGAVAASDAGDLEVRLETTGDVPAPPKKRRRR